jgi:hypothetical protein
VPPNTIATNLKKFAFGKGALVVAGGTSAPPIRSTSTAASTSSTGKVGVNSSDADKMSQAKLLQEAVKKQSVRK